MTFKRLPVALSGLAAMASLTAVAADIAGPQLMVEAKVALDSVADQHRGAPKWSHGAFLVQSVGPGGLPPAFYTLDREGRLLSSVTGVVPESAYVSVYGFDRRDDNSFVFIGETYSASGQRVPIIGLISGNGKTERVIRTAGYRPSMLGIAPDGTFWTLDTGLRTITLPARNSIPMRTC